MNATPPAVRQGDCPGGALRQVPPSRPDEGEVRFGREQDIQPARQSREECLLLVSAALALFAFVMAVILSEQAGAASAAALGLQAAAAFA